MKWVRDCNAYNLRSIDQMAKKLSLIDSFASIVMDHALIRVGTRGTGVSNSSNAVATHRLRSRYELATAITQDVKDRSP